MKKIVIIGASVSGHCIALGLRERDLSSQITLITEENYPAYDRLRLPDFISGITLEQNLFLGNEDFYQQHNINFLKSKKVASLNTQKKLIYFKEKGNLEYDFLVIASGRSPSIADIPGAKKEGVFRLYNLDDTKELLKRYISEPICIIGSNSLALKTAEALAIKYSSEIKFLTHSVIDPSLVCQGIEVIQDDICEIIGDGQTEAIKLKQGKVIAVSAVLFMDNYKSNIDFLKNSNVEIKDDFVVVNETLKTNIENIFACGSVINKDSVGISLIAVESIIKQMGQEVCQTL